jgi:hypothetical protein
MIIESTKSYKNHDVDQIFFRPSFCGKSAEELGIRVLYNMPMPTTVHIWSRPDNILQEFASGWDGGQSAQKFQKTINMRKVKAETQFSADDYFSLVFEKLVSGSDISYQDLTGTELEKAETELFRQAIVEGIRSTMWIGDISGIVSDLTTFNGFFRQILNMDEDVAAQVIAEADATPSAIEMFKGCWNNATPELKSLRSEGELVYFVSSDVYNSYLDELEEKGTDSAYQDTINGHPSLCYRGIPIVEVPLAHYNTDRFSTFCMLTDRRNLVLALNTSDMPENEVRMWYNPDEMENRQRAIFLAGADVIDQKLVSIYYSLF